MVRMGAVWDSTTQVLGGRGATIARVAILTLFLPSVLQAGLPLALGVGRGARLAGAIVSLLLIVVTLLGTLAITALASDPKTGEREAWAGARRALPATLGAVLLIGAALGLLLIPGVALLVRSGFDTRGAADAAQPAVAPGPLLGALVYFLIYAALALWVVARTLPLYAVLINERRGVGAIRRAWALTRGLAARIAGVLILYVVVVTVAWSATTLVFGTVFRLLLGPEQPAAALLTALAAAVVLTGFGMIQPVFAARLYAAIRAAREDPAPAA